MSHLLVLKNIIPKSKVIFVLCVENKKNGLFCKIKHKPRYSFVRFSPLEPIFSLVRNIDSYYISQNLLIKLKL